MSEPVMAAQAPIGMDVDAGNTHWFCTRKHSAHQPLCDGSHKKL